MGQAGTRWVLRCYARAAATACVLTKRAGFNSWSQRLPSVLGHNACNPARRPSADVYTNVAQLRDWIDATIEELLYAELAGWGEAMRQRAKQI